MRIALLSPLFESVPPRLYGGTERVIYNLCRGLNENNIEVTLFASGDSTVEGRIIPVIDEALRLRRKPVRDPYAYNLKMLSMVAAQSGEFDVIHNHHDYWMLPLSQMTRTPIVTTLHGRLDIADIPAAFNGYRNSNYVSITDSQRVGIPRLNFIKTVYNGIDVDSLEYHPKPGKYLAFLGRIDADKRPDYAIEIAKKSGVPLKIAAKIEGKASQDYYDYYVKPHVDGKFIEYVGEISESEKSEYLGKALALVFPIDWPEPFGLVMVESLACGTPVLARPCGSVPEVLKDGVTGYVDASLDVLAKRVRDLGRISREGCRKYVEERFSLSRMTEDYIHVYEQLARGADHRRWDLLHPFERVADRNS